MICSFRAQCARLAFVTGFLVFSSSPKTFAAPPALASSLIPSEAPSLQPMRAGVPEYPWKVDVVGTVFWIGEKPSKRNPTSNVGSSWDPHWMTRFGGFDDPDVSARAEDYRPSGFVPQLNPFYVALPYNDCLNSDVTKVEAAKVIPWFKKTFVKAGKSVCHNRWIAIRHGGRTCYAQWSDCGPFATNDASYVFGNSRPANSKNNGAGIDLSPAVRDFLRFSSGRNCDWRFVEESAVPDGPWKGYGSNNPFSRSATKTSVIAAASSVSEQKSSDNNTVKLVASTANLSESARLEELKRQRDAWFRSQH